MVMAFALDFIWCVQGKMVRLRVIALKNQESFCVSSGQPALGDPSCRVGVLLVAVIKVRTGNFAITYYIYIYDELHLCKLQ